MSEESCIVALFESGGGGRGRGSAAASKREPGEQMEAHQKCVPLQVANLHVMRAQAILGTNIPSLCLKPPCPQAPAAVLRAKRLFLPPPCAPFPKPNPQLATWTQRAAPSTWSPCCPS